MREQFVYLTGVPVDNNVLKITEFLIVILFFSSLLLVKSESHKFWNSGKIPVSI